MVTLKKQNSKELDPTFLWNRIKKNSKSLKRIQTETNHVVAQLFVDVYCWIEIMMATGRIRFHDQGFRMLGDSFKRHSASFRNYYQSGKFMKENRLQAKSVNSSSVAVCRHLKSQVKRNAFYKILEMIRKRESGSAVKAELHKAQKISGHAATMRATTAKRKGRWTQTDLKLEMSVVKTLLAEFFDTKITLQAVELDSDEILLEV